MAAKKTRIRRPWHRYDSYRHREPQSHLIVHVGSRRHRMLRTQRLSQISWVPKIIAKRLARMGYQTFEHLVYVLDTRPLYVHKRLKEAIQAARHEAAEERKSKRTGDKSTTIAYHIYGDGLLMNQRLFLVS